MKVNFLVAVFFFVLSVLVLWPLPIHLTDSIVNQYDGLLLTWIINFGAHSLVSNPLGFLNANIFYPYTFTFAYSDFHLISSLILSPFY